MLCRPKLTSAPKCNFKFYLRKLLQTNQQTNDQPAKARLPKSRAYHSTIDQRHLLGPPQLQLELTAQASIQATSARLKSAPLTQSPILWPQLSVRYRMHHISCPIGLLLGDGKVTPTLQITFSVCPVWQRGSLYWIFLWKGNNDWRHLAVQLLSVCWFFLKTWS